MNKDQPNNSREAMQQLCMHVEQTEKMRIKLSIIVGVWQLYTDAIKNGVNDKTIKAMRQLCMDAEEHGEEATILDAMLLLMRNEIMCNEKIGEKAIIIEKIGKKAIIIIEAMQQLFMRAEKMKKDKLKNRIIEATQQLIMFAVENGYTDVMKLLIENGADVDKQDMYGMTALMMAAGSGNTDAMQILIKKGADVDKQDMNGQTALIRTALIGNTDAMQILIEKGADVDKQDMNGMTALMMAARSGNTDAMQILIKKGADVNKQDIDDMTALIYTAIIGNTDAMLILIKNGADVYLKDHYERTALNISINKQHKECGFFLKEKKSTKKARATLRELFNNCEDENAINEAIQKIKATDMGNDGTLHQYGSCIASVQPTFTPSSALTPESSSSSDAPSSNQEILVADEEKEHQPGF